MKTKKALAVLLAVVMLVVPLSVSSFAVTREIVTAPVKTAYVDSEYFNPIGLVIAVDGVNITYSPTDPKFRFDPTLNELLTVPEPYDHDNNSATPDIADPYSYVNVYYDNAFVGTVPVTVDHILGDLTVINNGHGHYCLGCGALHDFEKHIVTEWIPNDDAGILTAQTKTGYCTECGAEVTEAIPGSEKFEDIFLGNGNLTDTEFKFMLLFKTIIVSLVQMLVGIS